MLVSKAKLPLRGSYCWGSDTSGQLGNGSGVTGNQVSPSAVDISAISGNKGLVKITAGGSHACAVTADALVYCWGADSVSQLGNGATLSSNQVSPSLVNTADLSGEKGMQNVFANSSHTCALTPKGTAYCWGADTNGRLGNGSTLTSEQQSPSQVDPWYFY